MSHYYLNLWLSIPIFHHRPILNLWPCATEMREPVCLRGTTPQVQLFTSEMVAVAVAVEEVIS
jgi:hypothetical protein